MLQLLGTSSILRVTCGSVGDVRVLRTIFTAPKTFGASSGVTLGSGVSEVLAAITGTTPTTIVPSPGSGSDAVGIKFIDIFNMGVSNLILVEVFDGTNTAVLFRGTLAQYESVVIGETGYVEVLGADGIPKAPSLPLTTKGDLFGYDTGPNRVAVGADRQLLVADSAAAAGVRWATAEATNASTANQTGFSSDTYLAGSRILMPSGGPIAKAQYYCAFDMVKTAAGTAAIAINVRFGTAGTTADTARLTFTLGAGTAAVDTGFFELFIHFRTVGASAVAVGVLRMTHALAATGLTTTGASGAAQLMVTSGAFDSAVANSGIGVSFNGGASFSGTNVVVRSKADDLS